MIKVVFFDIDDTLLSFSGYVKEAMRDGFARFGLPPYTEAMFPVFERINNGLWKQIEQGTLTFEELLKIRWNRIFQALGIAFDGERFEEYFRKKLFDSAVLEPGAKELLEYLAPRYTLCIVSNGPCAQQMNRLRVGGLDGYFSRFFVSEQIGAQKPDPAFFEYCFRELRENGLPELRPDEVMLIGDSVSADIAGGKAFGLRTCLYRSGGGERVPEADHTVQALAEIARIL